MIIEVTVERFLKPGDLGAHPGAGHLRQHVRVAFAGNQRCPTSLSSKPTVRDCPLRHFRNRCRRSVNSP